MTPKEFEKELAARTGRLKSLFGEARKLDLQVEKQLATLTASPAEGRDRSPQRSGE